MDKHQTRNLPEAKAKLNRTIGLMDAVQRKEYPRTFDLRRAIEMMDMLLHWGNEMIRHGATKEDFAGHEWIGEMLGAKPKPFHKRILASIRG